MSFVNISLEHNKDIYLWEHVGLLALSVVSMKDARKGTKNTSHRH